MSPIGSYVWALGPQLMVLLQEVWNIEAAELCWKTEVTKGGLYILTSLPAHLHHFLCVDEMCSLCFWTAMSALNSAAMPPCHDGSCLSGTISQKKPFPSKLLFVRVFCHSNSKDINTLSLREHRKHSPHREHGQASSI